jgi:hypothetical protein
MRKPQLYGKVVEKMHTRENVAGDRDRFLAGIGSISR